MNASVIGTIVSLRNASNDEIAVVVNQNARHLQLGGSADLRQRRGRGGFLVREQTGPAPDGIAPWPDSRESSESVTITLRIDPRMLARIKRLARSRYLNYQSMIKQWLSERMEHELRER